ncbi:MAG TPA: ribonuclease HII [Ktedonobacterales bacterium]|jgi:ribonuclease HII|nr:ribonuclease HII [Ktedonobacterales bacterium]
MSDASDAGANAAQPAWSQATLMTADPQPQPLRRCGLDEVGRGALAGPLVAAAVILPDDIRERLGKLAPFLRDSKLTPRGKREAVALALRDHALAISLAVAPVSVIDQRGIGWANRDVFRRLISQIDADEYIVDGKVKPPAPIDRSARVRCMVKADAHTPAVSAASIIAKVYRDHLMVELSRAHGGYGWERNAGYGSAEHLTALRTLGPTQHHRALFVATALSGGQRAKHDRQHDAIADTEEPRLL